MKDKPAGASLFSLKHLRKFLPVAEDEFILLEEAGGKLFSLLSTLDLQELPVSDYTRKYLGNYLKRMHYGIETAAYLIAHAANTNGKKINELSILDHGAGTGIICLYAKLCGCKAVYYQDIFEESVKDARITAGHLDLRADAYFEGDTFLYADKQIDAVVSRNVIEHVYDPAALLRELGAINKSGLCLVFATTANIYNPATQLYTRRLQKKIETKGFQSVHGKKSDTQEAFYQIRKKALQQAFPDIRTERLNLLAKNSRGKMIHEFIEDVKINDENFIPTSITDPYNTCNPINGNWTERLTPVSEYQKWFQQAGFSFQCRNGFYDTHYHKKYINLLTSLLNSMIDDGSKASRTLSPFITLVGKYN